MILYFKIGSILGALFLIIFSVLTVKNRWFGKNDLLEAFYNWWDGKRWNNHIFDELGIPLFVLISLVLLISLFWILVIPVSIMILVVYKIRNKKVNKLNK